MKKILLSASILAFALGFSNTASAVIYRGVFEAKPIGGDVYSLSCTGSFMNCGVTYTDPKGRKIFKDWLGREWLILNESAEPPNEEIDEIGEAKLCEDC